MALTQLGIIHTAISLVAVAAAIIALVRVHEIRLRTPIGQVYWWGTMLSAVTGLFIYQHGGFGKPHVLSILTIVVLLVAWVAMFTDAFTAKRRLVANLCLTLTVFFHTIPGATETGTRLPKASPLFSSPEDPKLVALVGAFFVLYLIGQVAQIRWMRRHPA